MGLRGMACSEPDREAFFVECPMPAFVAAQDGLITSVNPLLRAVLGDAAQALVGTPWIDLVPDLERDSAHRVLEAGGVCSWTSWVAAGAGHVKWFRWCCRRSFLDGRVFGTGSDITDEKQGDLEHVVQNAVRHSGWAERAIREEELRRSRDLLGLMLEHVPMLLWTLDMNGVFTYVDGMGLDRMGVKSHEVVGQSFFERFEKYPRVVDSVWRALQGDNSLQTTEFGGVVWDNRYLVMRDERGDMVGVAGLALDVSERVRTEEELRRRLAIIEWQRDEIRSLSMPILKVWDDVVAVPVIGTVTVERAGLLAEAVLKAVVKERARFVILDLTGAEIVDVPSAEGVLKVGQVVALVGSRTILAGIQPKMAIAAIEGGADLSSMAAFRNLRQAIRFCMKQKKR